jgi:hypothetical protein
LGRNALVPAFDGEGDEVAEMNTLGSAGARVHWCVVAGVVIALHWMASAQTCAGEDADCDGIPDRTEHQLLETYRPFYRFSRDHGDEETFRPADVGQYLSVSEIDGSGKEGDKILISRTSLAGDRMQLVRVTANNVTRNFTRTEVYINPDNDIGRRGAPWSEVLASRRTGLYGHVVPIYLGNGEGYDRSHVPTGADRQNKIRYYKIEYWQFFGYSSNNQPLDEGDHEGDWDTLQLIIEPANPAAGAPSRIHSVLYYAHGKELAFDMSSVTGSVLMDGGSVTEYRGSQYNQPVPNLNDSDFMEPKARNHVLRMFKDPVTGSFTHPVVFVEHGGHEFWPSPFWEMIGAQKHGGDDNAHTYLTETPPNLGEVEHPLTEEPFAPIIVQFNGYWGTYSRSLPGIFSNNPPPGPPLHYGWSYPVDSSVRWQLQKKDMEW